MAEEHIGVTLLVKNKQLANDLKASQREVAKLRNSFAELGNTTVRVERQVNGMGKSLRGLGTLAKGFAGVAAASVFLGTLRSWSQYVSAVQAASSQLRAVSNSSEEFVRSQQAVLQIANSTGSAYTDVASSVARFTRAIADFGGTADDAAIISDSLSKALIITGASATESSASLQQLGQALASGRLNGDELRSLLENAPIAARAVAETMGVTLGQLKDLGAEGAITTDIVANALIENNAKIAAEAAKIPLTLERSITKANNEIQNFVANSAELNGAATSAGNSIQILTARVLGLAEELVKTDTGFNETFVAVTGLTGPMDLLTRALEGVILGFYTAAKAVKFVIDIFVEFGQITVGVVAEALTATIKIAQRFGPAFFDAIKAAFTGDTTGVAIAIGKFSADTQVILANALNGITQTIESNYGDILGDIVELVDGVADQWNKLGTVLTPPKVDLEASNAITAPIKAVEDAAIAAAAEVAALDASLKNLNNSTFDSGKTTGEMDLIGEKLARMREEAAAFKAQWIEAGMVVIDAFGGAFQAIIDGSVSAKDALRQLLEDLLILIAKAAILSALGGGSFGANLAAGITGRSAGGGGGYTGFGGFSARSGGSTVRIYNQGGGLVNTQTRSNGDVDVMIGAMATAISRGGNTFDQVLRRTYGLDRRGV